MKLINAVINTTEECLQNQEKYEKKYGKERTIVFTQIGSFYEAYSTDTRGYKLSEISELLNIVYTRKDKSISQIDEKNPYMLGFPVVSLHKFMKVLVDSGYTVIIIDQVTPPPNPKREVTGIYSPGTYVQNVLTPDANYIVSLYIEEEIQKNGKPIICIGMAALDLTTGKSIVNEAISVHGDEKYALDEAIRFINSLNPKEILIHHSSHKLAECMRKDSLISYLELDNKMYHYTDNTESYFFKVSFQNEFLLKIYSNKEDVGMLSALEYLDLDRMPYCAVSFIVLLDFAYQHNDKITKNLQKPLLFDNQHHLILGNNALFQLNILESNSYEFSNNRFKSLFDVINNTSTAMGKRALKSRLLFPLVSPQELNTMYDYVEEMIKDKKYSNYEMKLREIVDIERLNRKMIILSLHPYELADFIHSLAQIEMIIEVMSENKIMKNMVPNKQIIQQLKSFLKKSDEMFDVVEMKKQHLTDITVSFFRKGIYEEVDEIQNEINNNMNFMDSLCNILSEFVVDDLNKPKPKYKPLGVPVAQEEVKIQLKRNDREGYYLCLTKLRAVNLKKHFSQIPSIQIGNYKLITSEVIFKDLGGNSKVYFPDLNSKSDELENLQDQLKKITYDYYVKTLRAIIKEYDPLFQSMTAFISLVDMVKSNAKTAVFYNYKKPTIKHNKAHGFVECKALRHPIIERILDGFEYVPHDISLGNDMKGMLLFGLNACGKSSLMKALGLSIIMAQAGMFVAASEFVFSPYNALYARITGNDNIFKGLSSFALEMTELRSILKRAGPHTLIIGDEVCRGTEHVSGNAIVAATIINLHKSLASFIFATHLHGIADMKRIKELTSIKSYHLTVEYDEAEDILIYDRKLKPGPGEPIYGVLVAKKIIGDKDFIKLAQEITNELMGTPNQLLTNKTSKYNSSIIIDKCGMCEKKYIDTKDHTSHFDTHHINFQKDCKEGFVIEKPHLKKNAEANLVVLCKECHFKVHNDPNIKIKGYVQTSNGPKLIVEYLEGAKVDDKDMKLIDSDSNSNKSNSDERIITKNKIIKISKSNASSDEPDSENMPITPKNKVIKLDEVDSDDKKTTKKSKLDEVDSDDKKTTKKSKLDETDDKVNTVKKEKTIKSGKIANVKNAKKKAKETKIEDDNSSDDNSSDEQVKKPKKSKAKAKSPKKKSPKKKPAKKAPKKEVKNKKTK